jgi:2-polyprenyl-3-methyl-5-hydroxy-6-metoxy-1,4-benzoquinol methylase
MSAPADDRTSDPAARLEQSWTTNADAWCDVVRENRIESRRVATDAAIRTAVLDGSPHRVLDLGCGEGWLCRALAEEGVEAVGVDTSAPLIQAAREQGEGEFHVCSYADIVADPDRLGGPYDGITCNFSLLGDDLEPLLEALHTLCTSEGRLVVQTVHPWQARGEEPYTDGWRTEDFQSFDAPFDEPMPWYYRTLSSWVNLMVETGWPLTAVAEPLHPESKDPLSLLLSCTTAPKQ